MAEKPVTVTNDVDHALWVKSHSYATEYEAIQIADFTKNDELTGILQKQGKRGFGLVAVLRQYNTNGATLIFMLNAVG